ncbi:family 20 glycosylhydrolase [uncultured Bacteroides sp.]|uniref:glycoside hydrolase family 20 protein n=1 Tax=uncultured Bacteroides sp. TaxID=162156 RepID=UPI0026361476|nr:family 20 glycosylhydrolase [uncultured Bacteroides sp.]
MKKNAVKVWVVCLLAVGGLMACGTQEIRTGSLSVIPLPQEVVETPSAAPFVINSSTTICYEEGNEKLASTARLLADYIREVTGTEVKTATKAGKNSIVLRTDPSIGHKEGYELNVTADAVTLTGATEAGVFYGCQTIHKALPITGGKALASLPAGEVKDFPQYNYRGFMIDVGRHFFSKEYLKKLIDVMALHNINYFHWHLTEDQGWRIEIKKYPKLTEIGSYRKATMIAWGSDEDDGTPVSGYYTQEDAKEIVAYAAERFITVIPEIDMPGHMLAALASYPELGCTGGPYETAIRFGVFKEVLCGGNPKTLQFAKDVVNELMDIFPDAPYIHIGGDECPKAEWEKCPKCQAKIKELGLRDTKEHSKENQLQVYFMSEVQKEIAKRGKKMLAWDEILEGNPNPETTTVMAWTSAGASVKAARLGHHTIVCPISHLYFSNPGYNRLKGISSMERVYTFEPQSEKLTLEEKKNIIGVQGCIWTEWTKDSLKMEWQMMPRIAALSELQWGNPAKKDLGGFLKRLRHQLDLYGVHSCHYKEDIEDVTISVSPKGQDGAAVVELSTFDNAPVYYTLDGSEPTDQSQLYTEPFTINQTATIKARAIRNGRASNIAEETLTYNLATMRPITLQCEPDERYTYQGADLLVNGLEGNDNYRSGRYIGIYGQDFDATVDLQEAKEISSVSLGTYLVPGDYIFGLSGLEIYGSNDGSTYNKIASKTIPVLEKGSKNNVLKRDTISFDKVQARYVRIVGKKTPELPKWHPGAGKQAYLFLDEIAID